VVEHGEFGVRGGVADREPGGEAVALRLGEGIGALHLDRVLRGEDEERLLDSSRADCVFGDARLISSPTTMFAKIAPGLNSNSRLSWFQTETPVMSLGSRSGVNWIRRTEQSMLRARAFASMVLPTPGTSSISR
jgi:hypothetical protein